MKTQLPSQDTNANQDPVKPTEKNPTEQGQPKKKKKLRLGTLLLMCFLFLTTATAVVMGYLYFMNKATYKNLDAEKSRLEEEKAALEQANNVLTEEKASLTEDKTKLEAEVADYEKKQAKIKAYNDFDAYVFYVVGIHGGFVNLTESEYQTARSKAQATKDQDLVAAVDSAWNDTHISQIIRFVNVMNAVIDGIDENCQ